MCVCLYFDQFFFSISKIDKDKKKIKCVIEL
jgi:hypothetical protein